MFEQADEVVILRHDNHASLARRPMDHMVFRVPKAEVANGTRLDLKALYDPRCESGRQLGIDPNRQPATTG